MDLCDELGLLVMDEVFDQWSICKGANDYGRLCEKWWKRDLRMWIRTDRNHPSVIIWGFGNETCCALMTRDEFFFPVTFGKRRTTYGFPYWNYLA